MKETLGKFNEFLNLDFFLFNHCSICFCCQINRSILTILTFSFFLLAFEALPTARSGSPVTLTEFFDSFCFGKAVSTKLSFDSSLISLSNFSSFALCFLIRLSRSDTFTNLRRSKFICLFNFSHLEFLRSWWLSSRCLLFLITCALATWTPPEKASFKEISNAVSKFSYYYI